MKIDEPNGSVSEQSIDVESEINDYGAISKANQKKSFKNLKKLLVGDNSA